MIDVSTLDKDQLADYAKTTFSVDLDMRASLEKLRTQVKALQEKPKPVVITAPPTPQATHILNRETGMWFPWTAMLANHLTNAVPCDEYGNPV